MPSPRFKASLGPLLGILLIPLPICAQTARLIAVTVEDSRGAAIAGAAIADSSGRLLGHTNTDGRFSVQCNSPCTVSVQATGFSDKSVQISAPTTIQLAPAVNAVQVTVTAYRAPLGELQSPVTTRVLSDSALSTTATFTRDDQVRQLPGVELFRRSSSLVANPTSQGISVRGLGSTAASRTLVTEDDVPLNDAIGGWIHWQEQPELAIQSVELVRGGASDLYGSSAIGGVMNFITARPTSNLAEVRARPLVS